MIKKIVSGGQTGVDRAALDVAIELGILSGGWCPRGRKAEDGPIALCYPLCETPSNEYAQRTEWNVRDSDGTLVLTRGQPTQGTAFTIHVATRYQRPYLVIDLDQNPNENIVRGWTRENNIRTVNVAGPREEKLPGTYGKALRFLRQVLGGQQDS